MPEHDLAWRYRVFRKDDVIVGQNPMLSAARE
jgi:hypothetical protein